MERPEVAVFLFVVAIVLLVLVAGPIILLLRITPGYKKARENAQLAEMHAGDINADYARAGFEVKRGGFLYAVRATGAHAGIAVTQKVSPPGKNTPSEVVIAVSSEMRGEFRVTREGAGDLFVRQIGFSDKTLTGDADFDQKFFLEGASRDYVQAVFADAGNRDAVRALFVLGFDYVELDGGEVSATKTKVELRLVDLPLLTDVVEHLVTLRTPPGLTGTAMKVGISTKHIQGALIAGVLIATPLMFWAFVWTRPTAEGWWQAAQRESSMIALACAVLVAVPVVALRGRAGAHRELNVIAAVLPLLAFGGWCAAVIANEKLDVSTLDTREVRVLNKYMRHRQNSTRCDLELESWRRDLDRVSFVVPCGIYARVKLDQTVSVGTHAGRLGIEWISSVDGSAL